MADASPVAPPQAAPGNSSQPGTRTARRAIRVALIAAVVLAIFLAAYLRLAHLERSHSGGDQAVLVSIALRWVVHGQFPLASNKSSVGLMNPPLLEYLLAIPLLFQRNMLAVAQFVALVNLASVVATFLVVRALFGPRLALLATLLYAVNPWSVYYSRLIWNPTVIPLFSALLLGSLPMAIVSRRKALHLALTFVWLAAVIQLHLGSLILALAVGLVLLIFRKQIALKSLVVGALLFALTFAPFLVYEQETGFADVGEYLRSERPTETNLASVKIVLGMAGETGIARTLGSAAPQWRAASPWGEELNALADWLLLAGLIVAGAMLARRRDEFRARRFTPTTAGLVTSVTLIAVPILLNLRHAVYLQNYYFLYLYPVLFVVMALPADAALAWASRLPRERRRILLPIALLPALLMAALFARQAYLNVVGLQLIAQDAPGAPQIRHVQQAIDTLVDLNREQPDCDLIVASDGYTADRSSLGQLIDFLTPRPVRYVRLGSGAIVPRACAFYLVAGDDARARAWYEAHAVRLPDRTIRLPNDAWHFYVMAPEARAALVGRLADAATLGEWETGLRLRRAEVSGELRAGSTLGLTYFWEVGNAPPDMEVHFFSHLLDASGALVAQADGPGVHSRHWQPGEFFVTWFEVPVPADAAPGDYRLALGMYAWPSLERFRLTGNGDSLTVAKAALLP